mmetsp:Transcript_80808/g.163710  ORF Transcript_80808/g.163710 Transcript_80808/m.163710 type:complete len:84 (-) Transcript_80808:300-551(-)
MLCMKQPKRAHLKLERIFQAHIERQYTSQSCFELEGRETSFSQIPKRISTEPNSKDSACVELLELGKGQSNIFPVWMNHLDPL